MCPRRASVWPVPALCSATLVRLRFCGVVLMRELCGTAGKTTNANPSKFEAGSAYSTVCFAVYPSRAMIWYLTSLPF